jgi:hypothetical protein
MPSTGSHSAGAPDLNPTAVVQAASAQEAAAQVPSTPHGGMVPNTAYTQQYLDAQRAHYEDSEGNTSRAGPFRPSVARSSHPAQGGEGYLVPGRTRPRVSSYAEFLS